MIDKILTIKGSSSDLELSNNDNDPLDKIALSKDKYAEIIGKAGSKTLARKLPIYGTLLEAVESFNQGVREEKLSILLQGFEKRFESSEEALRQFQKLFQSRAGVIIFEKIIHILDDGAEDKEWIDLLSNVLKNILNNEVEKQFEAQSYILAQISRLSPQALIVLSKKEKWHSYKFTGSTTTSKQTIVGDWDTQIAKFFASATSITDKSITSRIAHTFRELESIGMVSISESKKLTCTEIGEMVRNSICQKSAE